jgi:hypothetical protein
VLHYEAHSENQMRPGSVVEAHRVEIVHVRGKGTFYPPGAHDFKAVQLEATRILSQLFCLHFYRGKQWVLIFRPRLTFNEAKSSAPECNDIARRMGKSWTILSKSRHSPAAWRRTLNGRDPRVHAERGRFPAVTAIQPEKFGATRRAQALLEREADFNGGSPEQMAREVQSSF